MTEPKWPTPPGMGGGPTSGAQYARHISWNTKLFDSKIAEVAENKYDGINGGDK